MNYLDFNEFHFLRPIWLWAILPLMAVVLLWARHRLSKGSWAEVCDAELLPYILEDSPGVRARWPLYLFALCGMVSIMALAGPTWERLPAPVFRNESALVIVLDLSRSMDVADIRPSRLQRARYKIIDILKQRKDGQTALVVYAEDAFTVTPLTDDTGTISSQLSSLSTSMMPVQGSRAKKALMRAEALLEQAGVRNGRILLVTDSVDSAVRSVARDLKHKGYELLVLGVGTENGAPIPLSRGGFLKDSDGNIVLPKLRTGELEALALGLMESGDR